MENLIRHQSFTHQCQLLLLLASLPFLFTYLITSLTAILVQNRSGKHINSLLNIPWVGHGLPYTRVSDVSCEDNGLAIRPPVAPYFIPWVGHGLAFFTNPTRLALSVK